MIVPESFLPCLARISTRSLSYIPQWAFIHFTLVFPALPWICLHILSVIGFSKYVGWVWGNIYQESIVCVDDTVIRHYSQVCCDDCIWCIEWRRVCSCWQKFLPVYEKASWTRLYLSQYSQNNPRWSMSTLFSFLLYISQKKSSICYKMSMSCY